MADTTTDFGDDGFHEIQLSGKQLVFLFMATTVLSVIIFLTGVMVGRNARLDRAADAGAAAVATPATATDTAATTSAPVIPSEQPTPVADDDLTYRKRLEAEGTPVEQLAKPGTTAPAPAKADEAPEPAAEGVAASAKGATPPAAPATEPPKAAADSAKTAAPAAAATAGRPGRYVVQLVVLRDRNAASSIVRRLTSKGYPAFVALDSSSSNALYKVQVGRFDDEREAQRVARRLEKEEKYKPWISPR